MLAALRETSHAGSPFSANVTVHSFALAQHLEHINERPVFNLKHFVGEESAIRVDKATLLHWQQPPA